MVYDRCVGLHIRKCAGTSLATYVRHHLPDGSYYLFSSFYENRRAGRPEFFEIKEPNWLRFVFGHRLSQEMVRVLWNGTTLLFTGLREPKERILSDYRHYVTLSASHGISMPSADTFIADLSQSMCQALVQNFPLAAELGGGQTLVEKAISVISLFDHIYETKGFEDSIRPVIRALRVDGVLDVKDNVSPAGSETREEQERELMALIDRATSDDRDLYDFVQFNSESDAHGRRRLKRCALSVSLADLLDAMPTMDTCLSIVRDQLIGELVYEARLIGRSDELRKDLDWRIEVARRILSELETE